MVASRAAHLATAVATAVLLACTTAPTQPTINEGDVLRTISEGLKAREASFHSGRGQCTKIIWRSPDLVVTPDAAAEANEKVTPVAGDDGPPSLSLTAPVPEQEAWTIRWCLDAPRYLYEKRHLWPGDEWTLSGVHEHTLEAWDGESFLSYRICDGVASIGTAPPATIVGRCRHWIASSLHCEPKAGAFMSWSEVLASLTETSVQAASVEDSTGYVVSGRMEWKDGEHYSTVELRIAPDRGWAVVALSDRGFLNDGTPFYENRSCGRGWEQLGGLWLPRETIFEQYAFPEGERAWRFTEVWLANELADINETLDAQYFHWPLPLGVEATKYEHGADEVEFWTVGGSAAEVQAIIEEGPPQMEEASVN